MEGGFVSQVLNGTDDQLGSIFKSVCSAGRQNEFTAKLKEVAALRKEEVESISQKHYESLVLLIDKILSIKSDSNGLKESIVELNKELQLTGETVLVKKQEAFAYEKVQKNIQESIAALNDGLSVMHLCQKVHLEIATKKYFAALKTIESIPLIKISNYNFYKSVNSWIPLQHERIKEAAMGELRQWLTKVRDLSGIIGEMALEQYRSRHKKLTKFSSTIRRRFSLFTANSMEIITVDDQERDLLNNELVKINFKALYQCLHIYDFLGLRNQFQSSFADVRKLQATNLFATNIPVKEDLKQFESFLNIIAGYFIIEYHLINSPLNFHTRTHSDNLWEQAVIKINSYLSEAMRQFKSLEFFTRLKTVDVVFIQTMDGFTFSTASLIDILIGMFYTYIDIVKADVESSLLSIISNDDFSPIVVPNDQIYENYCVKFPFLQNPKFSFKRNQRVIPFSKALNDCYDKIVEFIETFYSFLEGIPQQNNELNDLAKKSVDNFMGVVIKNSLMEHAQNSKNLAQVLLIKSNLECFELLCACLESILAAKIYSSKVALNSRAAFQSVQAMIQYKIFELVNSKIDEFLSISEYDRCPKQSATQPSQYIRDIVGFLSSLCDSTSESAQKYEQGLYFTGFNHLVDSLTALINDTSFKVINFNFLKNLELDLIFLNSFTEEIGNPNIFNGFIELDQTIKLLLSDKIHEFLDASVRNKKYSRVKIPQLISLCSRLKEHNYENDAYCKQKQRMIEDFLKILKPK